MTEPARVPRQPGPPPEVPPLRPVDLDQAELHESLGAPVFESMNFLNEISSRYPDAISFAAGRPYEGFYKSEDLHRYLRTFTDYLLAGSGSADHVRTTLLQYGRTKGVIHHLIATNLALDENIVVDPDSIVVTVGCQEALFLTMRALRRTERDVLLAVQPCYVGVTGAAELADMPLLPVASSADGIDLADLERVVGQARAAGLTPRACYVVADFANPTGVRFSLETRRRLLALAAKHDFLVLEDNPYGIFHAVDGRTPTLKSMDHDRRVVYLGSFAKTGLPGARIGFAVADQWVATPAGPQLFADQLAKLKSMLTVNTPPIAQAVIGGKLLEHGCSLRSADTREVRLYQENLRLMLDGLARHFPPGSTPKVTWNTPAGGFFLVVEVPFDAGDDLLRHCASEYGVLWTPMHHFYGDGTPLRQIRLSFSYVTPGQISVGLDRLARFIRGQRGTAR